MFSSYRAVSYARTLPNGDRAAELCLDKWVPNWRARVAALTAPDPKKISQETALAMIMALEDTKRHVLPRQAHEAQALGDGNISGWWTDLKRWVKRTASDAWDTFTDTMKDAWDNLGDWDSFKDWADNVQFILTSGGSSLGKGAAAAAEEALTATIGPFLHDLGVVIGKAYGDSKNTVMRRARNWMKEQTGSKMAGEIAAETAGTVYDLSLGYPPCLCEEACIKPVADGLKKAGGVPAIIGNVLAAVYPVVQLTQAPQVAPALGYYAGGGVLLPNAKISDTKIVGDILNVISDEMDRKIGMPRSFELYRPWLVDLVARGSRGPATMTDQDRYARYYFERPEQAVAIIAEADKIGDPISGLFEILGKIDRYVDMALQAYKVGKGMVDTYRSINIDSLGQSLTAAVRETITAENMEKLGGWALSKGESFAKRQLHKQVRIAIQELGLQPYLDKLELAAKYSGRYLPPMGDGNISGPATSFLTQWMPASIGLQARAKYALMVQLWASMNETERDRWKHPPGGEAALWKRYATDFPAWHKKLSNDPKVAEYVFQLSAPRKYKIMAKAGDNAWERLNDSVRAAMRRGGYPTLFFVNFSGRLRIPKKPKAPNVLDTGWPLGHERPKGWDATPSQYYAWRQDMLDIIIPARFKVAFKHYEAVWKAMPAEFRRAWLKDTPDGPKNPPLVLEPKFLSDILARLPELRVTGTQFMTRNRFWALVMLTKYPNSLKVLDKSGLQAALKATREVTQALNSLPPKVIVGRPTLAGGYKAVSDLSLDLLDYDKARQEPGMGTAPDTGAAAPTTKRFPALPLTLGGVGLILLGLAQTKR